MRHRAFPGHGPEVEQRYLRASQWLLATIYQSERAREWCKSNGVRIQKASAEGINSAGAFLGDGTSTFGGMFGVSQIVLDGNHAKAKVTAAGTHNTFLTLDSTDLGN